MTDIYYNGFIRISTIKDKPEKLLLTLYDNNKYQKNTIVYKEIDNLKLKDMLREMYMKTEDWIYNHYAKEKL